MEVAHRNILRKKRMVLCQAINSQIIIERLSTSNILTKSDQETLKVISSNLKKNEKLLDILPKRGPKAFAAFLEVLKSTKLSHLLGDGYEDEGDKSVDNARNIKMDEARPPKKDKNYLDRKVNQVDEGTYDIIEAPSGKESHDVGTPMDKDSYDITDIPIGDKSVDNARNIILDEERPPKKDKNYLDRKVNQVDKGVYDIVDAPAGNESHDVVGTPMDKDSYDFTDTPIGHLSDSASKHPIDEKEDLDITSDHVGKQAKVEEPFEYDSVDTPRVISSFNGFAALTGSNVQPSGGMMLNTDVTDFQGHDATDSAPQSAASTECEDGPFSKLGNQKGKDVHTPQGDLLPSSMDHSNCYTMTTTPRGYFLLVNNKDFLPESKMESYPRNGTDLDAAAMVALFEELGYVTNCQRNLTCLQIRKAVKKIATMDYNKVSAVACCFLSHGKEGVLYGIDGEIEIRDLTSYFRDQKSLVGKPKMFFFQACQGSDYMDGIQPDGGRMEVDGPADKYGNDISLPTEADFIFAYSTVPGYYSWRNSARGSWFIQGIVEIFRKYAHKMDVIRMLTRVNEMVSRKKSATGQNASHNKRQISSVITQLRYELFLFPPHGPLKEYQPT